MRVALCALAAIMIVFGAVARPARADTGFLDKDVPVLEIDACSPDKDVARDELNRRGAEHYERGEVLYLQGDYKGAVQELVASYCEIPFYSILKDIGQAYERELEYAKAIAYLERYVLAVPADAQKANACAPDPQEDKANVLARIKVLQTLTAKIRVQTEPPDARISIVQNNIIQAAGSSGDELEVVGGPYQLVIERVGFHTVTKEIHAEIGKPYTYLEILKPLEGHVRIRVTPGDARIFIDQREVGTGVYETTMTAGTYALQAEAQGKVTQTQSLEVLPDRDTGVSLDLKATPEFGRRQLMIYGGIGGTIAGYLIGNAQASSYTVVAGAGAGLAAGLLGVYYGTPHDLALGTSSFTVTSSLIGAVGGGSLAAVLTGDLTGRGRVSAPLVGGGLLVGGVVGYYVGDQTKPSPGDAAVINSGALWGTVTGGLFALTFDTSSKVSGGLVLSGLAMGTAGGVLLQRYSTVSRGRAALIDASGIVGIVLGLAAESLIQRARNDSSQSDERTADYALGGLATGLIVGGILTRKMDEPKLAIVPTVQPSPTGQGGGTVGIAGAF